MLLSSAQKFSLLCPKLCSLNQHYARELTVLLECIKIPDCCIRVSDCSIRVSRSYFREVLLISQERVKIIAFLGMKYSKNVHCIPFTAVFLARALCI